MDDEPLSILAELTGHVSKGVLSAKTKTESDDKLPSIFDINKDDRNRILKLIEELLDTQEDVQKLRQKLTEEKSDYRERRSVLIKKLDLLSEKYEKALADNQNLTERYSSSLKQLEEKISVVSEKLETSVVEIKELRKANGDLVKENSTLRKLNKETVAVLASVQEERSRIRALDAQKHQEKRYRKKLKKASSELQITAADEKTRLVDNRSMPSQVESTYEMSSFHEEKDNIDKCCGAGDFIVERNPMSCENFKAPAIVIFDKHKQSAFSLKNHANAEVKQPSSTTDMRKVSSFNFNNDVEDTTLLENLFFRF